MILHGDERGRTQRGNNNVYAQDNELAWVDWELAKENWPLVEFTASVARLRRQHPTFRRRRFFDGRPAARAEGEPLPDIVWMTPAGALMKPEDWDAGFGRSIGMFMNGNGIRGMDTRGQRVIDDSFLLLFNAHDEPMDWILPPEEFAPAWRLVIDTSGVPDLPETIAGGSSVKVADKGMVVLQALAQAQEPLTTTHAAADVPTIAPVPVPMRAESGASLNDQALPPAESREPDEASVIEVPAPEAAATQEPEAAAPQEPQADAPEEPEADGPEERSASGQQFGDPEPAKPAARARRPKKK
jgi:glycogen operon protein